MRVNQLITFGQQDDTCLAMPYSSDSPTVFYLDYTSEDPNKAASVDLVTHDGAVLARDVANLTINDGVAVARLNNLSRYIGIGECFRLAKTIEYYEESKSISSAGLPERTFLVGADQQVEHAIWDISLRDWQLFIQGQHLRNFSDVKGKIVVTESETGEEVASSETIDFIDNYDFIGDIGGQVGDIVFISDFENLVFTVVITEIDGVDPQAEGISLTGVLEMRYAKLCGISNPLIRVVQDDGISGIKYRCNEEALGIPFGDAYIEGSVPLRLLNPQYTQNSNTYETKGGEVITLYAKYYKEWEGETDYLSEAVHDKIIAALSCDEVYINGKRVTKTDNYQIDWENYDLDCDGKTKLARATFKVRENITQRNSNY